MKTVEIHELTNRINELIQMLRENGESVDLTDQGKVIAHIVPVSEVPELEPNKQNDEWENLRRLSQEIGKYWTDGVDAVEAVRDVRREL